MGERERGTMWELFIKWTIIRAQVECVVAYCNTGVLQYNWFGVVGIPIQSLFVVGFNSFYVACRFMGSSSFNGLPTGKYPQYTSV